MFRKVEKPHATLDFRGRRIESSGPFDRRKNRRSRRLNFWIIKTPRQWEIPVGGRPLAAEATDSDGQPTENTEQL